MVNFNSGLTKPHLKLEYGGIVTVLFYDDMRWSISDFWNADSGIAIPSM